MARTAAKESKPGAVAPGAEGAETAALGTGAPAVERDAPASTTHSQAAHSQAAQANDIPFEQALERLEAVVDRLESGDLELEASLAAFEEGVRLSKRCASALEAAEQRVEILVREGGALTRRLFESGGASEDRGGGDALVSPADADEYDSGSR